MKIWNSRTPTECTNNVLAFKDGDIYLQNIKLQKYFVHTYELKIKVSILLKKSSTNFMLNSLGLFSIPLASNSHIDSVFSKQKSGIRAVMARFVNSNVKMILFLRTQSLALIQ